jgi:hypothetical protein
VSVADHDDLDEQLSAMDPDRRAFLRRMAIGAAVAPVVVSFSMSALSSQPAYAASNASFGSNFTEPAG